MDAQQRAADERLLEHQEVQSDKAATINTQVVREAQKRQDQIQAEPRIQDAPGPAQTGIVPASGPPAAPAVTDQRIQDAPGPTQTIPQPAQTPAPADTQAPTQVQTQPPQ